MMKINQFIERTCITICAFIVHDNLGEKVGRMVA